MTVDNVIQSIKPLINYDFNPAIRETLFPLDKFVKSALESALNDINTECRVIEKSLFIPLIYNRKKYELDLSSLTRSKFEIASPKNLVMMNSNNQIMKFHNRFLENIINQDEISGIFATAMHHLAQHNYVLSNTNISDSTSEEGAFDYITNANNLVIRTNGNDVDIDQYIINLDTADLGLYSYAIVDDYSDPDITISKNINTYPKWNADDKIYICDTLPFMFLFTFQATLSPGYFDTETEIPCPSAYLNDLPDMVIKYLYQNLAIRFPDQAKVYSQMLQTKLLKTSDEVIYSIKKLINSSIEAPIIKAYNPYPETYGR